MFILYILVFSLVSCTNVSERQLSNAEIDAVEKAESFVLRNGYMQKGYPHDVPVEKTEVLDGFLAKDELKNSRHDPLHEEAFGVIDIGGGCFYVLFRRKEPEGEIQPVIVKDGVAIQVIHSFMRKQGLIYVNVPRN